MEWFAQFQEFFTLAYGAVLAVILPFFIAGGILIAVSLLFRDIFFEGDL